MKSLFFASITLLVSSLAFAESDAQGPVDTLTLSPAADASIVADSYSVKNAAAVAFGDENSLDIGTYHLSSQALVRFNLSSLQGRSIAKVELVIAGDNLVPASPALIEVFRTAADWSEEAVTWDTRPAKLAIIGQGQIHNGENRIDVTAGVKALAADEDSLSLDLTSTSSSNLHLPSRESGMSPLSLVVTFDASDEAVSVPNSISGAD